MLSLKSRLYSILFWSVISAAFIGPGTLATASSAGAIYKLDLTWALVFATVACIVLQEMAARMAVVNNRSLSAILRDQRIKWPAWFVGFSVILGCAAYEAGNILGAISGIGVLLNINIQLLTVMVGLTAGGILWFGGISFVAKILGALVAVMGLVFVGVALQIDIPAHDLAQGALIPSIPSGSGWLVLGLIGTTIVPYNLFLGSGLGRGRALHEMRFGLITSVTLGGLISIAILITGTQISELTSFLDLARLLGNELGPWAYILMGSGLFAAGLTSSITSPLAAAVISQDLFTYKNNTHRVILYRLGWMVVLITGMIFGLLEAKPLPVILAAQALNGLILPIVGVVLIIRTNDPALLGDHINSKWLNILSFLVLEILLLIGLNNLWNALDKAMGIELPNETVKILLIQLLAIPFLVYTLKKVMDLRRTI